MATLMPDPRDDWRIAWQICLWAWKLTAIISLLAGHSVAAESDGKSPNEKPPFRSRPEPAVKAAAPQDANSVRPQDAGSDRTEARPLFPELTIYTMAGCRPCQAVEDDIRLGKLRAFRVRLLHREDDQVPEWVRWFPCFHWTGADGKSYVYPRQDGPEFQPPTFAGTEEFLRQFAATGQPVAPPVAPLAQSRQAVGSPLTDHLAKFFPEGTRLTIDPPRPVRATLDDGTVVTFSRLAGRLTYVGGAPVVTLDPPLPTVSTAKFFLRFGATINSAEYRDTTPPAVQVETSRGKYLIELREAR